MATLATGQAKDGWINYRAVWRWHFYAGLFCIPFVVWLAVTGSIYLFKPQIDAWIDRPYDRLVIRGPRATAAAQVAAAVAAVPGSTLHFYELPLTDHSATRVIVGKGTAEYRVYVQPQSLAILHVISEDERFTKIISRLHGELMIGDTGSMIVELAASWAIVMVLTGLYLWWPRQSEKLAGVVYPRLRAGKRIFWRDIHAVTGVWVSVLALFLLLTGLQWAKVWGGNFRTARTLAKGGVVHMDWTTGRSSELAGRVALNQTVVAPKPMESMPGMDMPGMDMGSMAGMDMSGGEGAYAPLDRVVATAGTLGLAYPALVSPPAKAGGAWGAKSDAQNRSLRTKVTIDGTTGRVLTRKEFGEQGWFDRMLATSISIHEGQSFGGLNQLLGLVTAMGLLLLSGSGAVMWWRRRSVGLLGAPVKVRSLRFSWALVGVIVLLGAYLPMFGGSLLVVLAVERWGLRRIPVTKAWLGI